MRQFFATFDPRELSIAGRFALILIVGSCLMGPIASDLIFPPSPDHPNHTAAVVQARQAIDEGQFPLRVAPWQHNGLRYPHFQYYSWLPFWVGGLLHKYAFPENPWVSVKTVYYLGLCFAAVWMYGSLRSLQLKSSSALAGSLAYMTAPYVLTNVYSRGAFTESAALAELPMAIWGAINILRGARREVILGAAALSLAVYMLASTHIITFVYGILFIGLFLAVLFIRSSIKVKRAAMVCGAILFGSFMGAHQLIPILSTTELSIRSSLSSPLPTQKYSPLGTVLAVGPAEPEPRGGEVVPQFWPQIGLPVLFCVGLALYLLLNDGIRTTVDRSILVAALSCFAMAVLGATTSVDVWQFLPRELYVIQFQYRLLAYSALFGAIVVGVAVECGEARYSWLPVGMFALILVSAAIWQPRMERNQRELTRVMSSPDLGYGASAYLLARSVAGEISGAPVVSDPVIAGDGWLNLRTKLSFTSAELRRTGGVLRITGRQAAEAKGCSELQVKVGASTVSVPSSTSEFTAAVTAAQLLEAAGGRSEFTVGFDSPCAFVPGPRDQRRLFMKVTSWSFQSDSKNGTAISSEEVARSCRWTGPKLNCEITSENAAALDLPMLYYPGLLNVTVSGGATKITPVARNEYLISRVSVPAGKTTVVAEFTGSPIGNTISLAAFLIWVAGLPVALWRSGVTKFQTAD